MVCIGWHEGYVASIACATYCQLFYWTSGDNKQTRSGYGKMTVKMEVDSLPGQVTKVSVAYTTTHVVCICDWLLRISYWRCSTRCSCFATSDRHTGRTSWPLSWSAAKLCQSFASRQYQLCSLWTFSRVYECQTLINTVTPYCYFLRCDSARSKLRWQV